MQQVALLAHEFRRCPHPLLAQALPAAAALSAALHPRTAGRLALVAQLLDVPEQAPTDHQGVPVGRAEGRDVDLAQVHPGGRPGAGGLMGCSSKGVAIVRASS